MNTEFKQKVLLLFILLINVLAANAQFAAKTNLLYDATTTPNIGLEIGIGKKHSVQMLFGFNPWDFNSSKGERKAKHWMLMPEYRWWTCSNFHGWFLGVHAMGGQFNAGNIALPFPGAFFGGENLRKELKDYRYEGYFLGGGITVGYQWILGRHWNLEAEAGVGYDHLWLDKHLCADCFKHLGSLKSNYVGLTKLGLCVMYVF